jgi:hypothetical protein
MAECLLLTKLRCSSATNVDSSDKINALMYFTSDYEEFSISFGVKSHSSPLQRLHGYQRCGTLKPFVT